MNQDVPAYRRIGIHDKGHIGNSLVLTVPWKHLSKLHYPEKSKPPTSSASLWMISKGAVIPSCWTRRRDVLFAPDARFLSSFPPQTLQVRLSSQSASPRIITCKARGHSLTPLWMHSTCDSVYWRSLSSADHHQLPSILVLSSVLLPWANHF